MSRGLVRSMFQPAAVLGATLIFLDVGCGGRIDPGGDFGPDGFDPDEPGYMAAGGSPGGDGDGGRPSTGSRPGRAGGPGVGGAVTGDGGRPATGGRPQPPPPPPRFCGNGVLDRGEDCDPAMPLDMTCSAATMGARPSGPLYCAPDCQFDTSGCYGQAGSGGRPGTGGTTGTGGMTSWQEECFAAEGVPQEASGSCLYGDLASRSCLFDYWGQESSNCQVSCGCRSCPGTMAECASDLACTWILGCAMQLGCGTLASCNEYPSCAGLIERSGGTNSAGSILARSALRCLSRDDCSTACP